jgi:predicted nucleic acid-binding Zn ribbon protein
MGEAEDRARVTYKCESCPSTSEVESEFKHDAACKPKIGGGLKKVCSKSGTSPHATEAK